MKDLQVRLEDGRDLAHSDIGKAHWPCVVLFGGAPTSRLRAADLEKNCLDMGIPSGVAGAARLRQIVGAAGSVDGQLGIRLRRARTCCNEMEAQLMRIGDEETAVAWCVERLGADGSRFFAAADFKVAEPDEAFFADDEDTRGCPRRRIRWPRVDDDALGRPR